MKGLAALFLLGTLLWPTGCAPKDRDAMRAPLAMVNDEAITVAELLALSPEEDRNRPPNENGADEDRAALRRALLELLIEKKMLLQEAKRLNIQLSKSEIDAKTAELRAAMDEQAAAKLMRKEEAAAREAFEAATKTNLLIEKLLKQVSQQDPAASLEATEAEIRDHYENHLSKWAVGEEIKLRQIVVETQEEAEAIYLSILDGADFEETARTHAGQNAGDGGALGYLQKQATPVEFDSLFRAEIGEVSPVIKTEFGYHIVKVEDRRPARTRSFEEVRDGIAAALRDQKREAIFAEWMSQLKQRTEVKIDEQLLEHYS